MEISTHDLIVLHGMLHGGHSEQFLCAYQWHVIDRQNYFEQANLAPDFVRH